MYINFSVHYVKYHPIPLLYPKGDGGLGT